MPRRSPLAHPPAASLGALLGSAASGLLDLLAPQRCGACEAEGALLCADCRATLLPSAGARGTLAPPPKGVGAAAFVGDYGTGLGAALRTLKFHDTPRLAQALGAALTPAIARVVVELGATGAVLVPMPTDRTRMRERGFDHALLLATAAADASGYPVAELLERTRAVPPLHRLGRLERRRALDGAVALRAASPGALSGTVPDGAAVVLVDDVWTSGATFEAAARALLPHCPRIGAVAVAREPLGAPQP